jgi:hypothetical protein
MLKNALLHWILRHYRMMNNQRNFWLTSSWPRKKSFQIDDFKGISNTFLWGKN